MTDQQTLRLEHEALMQRIAQLEAQLDSQAQTIESTQATVDADPLPLSIRALRESELRYRMLAENSRDMISRHAPDGRYTYASPACRHILGLEPHEVVGQDAYRFIYPPDHSVVRKAHDLQLDSAKPNTTTYRMVHATGKAVWVESTTHCTLNDQGHVQDIHVVTRDISDRMAAREALEKSEAQYRSLIECASDIILRIDSHGRIVYANSALSPEARDVLVGSYLVDRIIPQDQEQLRQMLHRVLVIGEPAHAELRVIPITCPSPWYNFRLAPIREDNRIVAATAIITNIGQRKETEQALLLVQSAINNVQDAVVITDTQLQSPGPHIVYVNPAFERMTGWKASDIVGKSPRVLQGPKTSRQVLRDLREKLSQGKIFHGETVNYRQDGSEYILEWDISPIRNAEGDVINYVSVQRDITQWRNQEKLTREHQAELAHVGRLSTLGEMASGLAHELNQPLAAITNYTRGCLRRLSTQPEHDPKIAQAIELAAMQADRAGQIIRRLRQFIRKRVPQHLPVDVNQVIRDAVTLMAGEVSKHEAHIVLELADDLPMVKADHIQIEQVLVNLLRNAFESMTALPAQERVVTVFSRALDQGVRVSVVDRGSGMDEATCLRLFEPFFTTKNRGLGMGLPICQSIIEMHSGRLWARSNSDPTLEIPSDQHVGGVFHFWLAQLNPDDVSKFTPAQDSEPEEHSI